jgi:hypothetical protein
MKLAGILLIVLAHQGYWFGGRQNTIIVRPAARGGLPAADIFWELSFGQVRVGRGQAEIDRNGDTTIHVTPPPVRTRVELRWDYRLIARDSGKELDHGVILLNVFPDDLCAQLPQRLGHKRLVVWDKPTGLSELLDRAKVPYIAVHSADRLQVMTADVLLVGPGAIGDSPFEQTPLAAMAEAGASVMIFRQTTPASLMGYALTDQNAPAAPRWLADHPLLNGFHPADLNGWLADRNELWVIGLPADEPALEIGYYPPETASNKPGPLDAVLVTKSTGAGRIVLCQLPLENWVTDPRSQMLLKNAIDYLLTRPRPTPRPSERPATRPTPPPDIPTIPLSPGDVP